MALPCSPKGDVHTLALLCVMLALGLVPAPGCQPSPTKHPTDPSKPEPGGNTPGGQQGAADHLLPHRPLTYGGDNLQQQAKVRQTTNPSSASLPLPQPHLCEGLALPLIPSTSSLRQA